MRLFLLPISTRRTLIYCQRLNQVAPQERPPLIDRLTNRAAKTWLEWERGDKSWQKAIVDMGNKVLRGVPYEEWGLKSIPPLSSRQRGDALSEQHHKEKEQEQEKFDVAFPARAISPDRVGDVVKKLATERQALHSTRMWWSIVGLPITLPIEYLLENKLINPTPSPTLDQLYESKLKQLRGNSSPQDLGSSPEKTSNSPDIAGELEGDGHPEMVLLQKSDGKLCADALGVPELAVEVERAVEQVEKSILASSGQPK
ncbi:MAG: hypothetical protein M1816_006044 [Peltula sp. TS41687]|nr:MAG: hypothetical protein M1816_006044 [Peltula sp. TS41687]